jgi:putative ABC transport system ATP-binding protein
MSLRITHLSKSYHQGSENLSILKDLNLEIKTSEIVSVVGASGSGKSTFLSLVAGLDRFDSGDIMINDKSIKNLSAAQMTQFRAENIGFIFQQFHLISHLTAFENLSLPLEILARSFSNQDIMNRLEQVGLAHRAQHKPTEMSGGECQRLALARGLITKPKLLLADEPSGNLDSETGQKVMNLFFEQIRQSKTTTVLVTHDMALAKRCERVFVLKNGQLVENK